MLSFSCNFWNKNVFSESFFSKLEGLDEGREPGIGVAVEAEKEGESRGEVGETGILKRSELIASAVYSVIVKYGGDGIGGVGGLGAAFAV